MKLSYAAFWLSMSLVQPALVEGFNGSYLDNLSPKQPARSPLPKKAAPAPKPRAADPNSGSYLDKLTGTNQGGSNAERAASAGTETNQGTAGSGFSSYANSLAAPAPAEASTPAQPQTTAAASTSQPEPVRASTSTNTEDVPTATPSSVDPVPTLRSFKVVDYEEQSERIAKATASVLEKMTNRQRSEAMQKKPDATGLATSSPVSLDDPDGMHAKAVKASVAEIQTVIASRIESAPKSVPGAATETATAVAEPAVAVTPKKMEVTNLRSTPMAVKKTVTEPVVVKKAVSEPVVVKKAVTEPVEVKKAVTEPKAFQKAAPEPKAFTKAAPEPKKTVATTPATTRSFESLSRMFSTADSPDDTNGFTVRPGASMTERMLKKVPSQNQAGGAGGSSTLEAFRRAEANWAKLKASKPFYYDNKLLRWEQDGRPPANQFVSSDGAFGNPQCWEKLSQQKGKGLDYDVAVCGGTLGIFFGMALLQQGHRVCVVEAGKLRGREQEWNISMDELVELKKLGIIDQNDIDAVITTEFPACRAGFKTKEVTPLAGGYFENGVGFECETPGVLNLGISPSTLLDIVAKRFKENGGVIKEQTRLSGVCISELAGSALDLGEDKEPITARLVLDAMGNASPISAQQRYGMKPDGVCAVVGSCAGGFDKETNTLGDIIYTNQNIVDTSEDSPNQYFWEAFPVGIGRNGQTKSDVKTTYMFTYMDADERRPSLENLMEDYWKLLPTYQQSISDPEKDLDIKRILFAYFPTYRDSPLKPNWSRILSVGDASGVQSPLSFGGFGALTRHLDRVGTALNEALEEDCLHKDDLGEVNAYMPNLSATWMFQKAMSVEAGKKNYNPEFINRLLSTNFKEMDAMGQKTMKPFLQDVVRFDGLVGSLVKSFAADPTFMPEIVSTVGLPVLVDWIGHVSMMGAYTVLDSTVPPLLNPFLSKMKNPRDKFMWRRRMDSWKYGSGKDYEFLKIDETEKDEELAQEIEVARESVKTP